MRVSIADFGVMEQKEESRMRNAGCGMQGQGASGVSSAISNLNVAFLLGILLAIQVAFSASSVFGTEVTLRERVAPKGSVVRLGDVAEIKSADRQEARRLAVVPLMPAPAPGTERHLRKREVADMLTANGIELSDIRFDGTERVVVIAQQGVQMAAAFEASADTAQPGNRHAAVLAGKPIPALTPKPVDNLPLDELRLRVEQIVGDYVKSKAGASVGRVECDVLDRHLKLIARATTLPVCDGGSEPWTGRQRLFLSFATETGHLRVPVSADVAEAAVPRVVAARAIGRGAVITAADVEVRLIEPAAISGQRTPVDSVESILGKESSQSIQVGNVVFEDAVRSPLMVKRGEIITVASQGGGIRVRTTAKALQDGAQGALIQLESLQGKQRFDARVIGLREASVLTPTQASDSGPNSKKRVETAQRQPGR